MRQNYNLAMTVNKPKRGEDNWYKFCSVVIEEMETLRIDKGLLIDAVISHICDDLLFEDKMLLLNSIDFIREKDDFINRVISYLLKDVLKNKGITGLFVQNKGVQKLFIKGANAAAATWSLAQAEDLNDLEKQIQALKGKFIPTREKLNNIVGFMANYRKEDSIIFKLKVFTLNGEVKKRNKGARCYGKSIEMMTDILGPEMYKLYLDLIHLKYKDIIEEKRINRQINNDLDSAPNELEAINHTHACVIQEMFLRVYNIERKDGKSWFLSPEEALLIDIENLSL